MRLSVTRKTARKDDIATTIENIDAQIDELLAEVALVKERAEDRDEELEDLYFEASALKERMHNVVDTYRL